MSTMENINVVSVQPPSWTFDQEIYLIRCYKVNRESYSFIASLLSKEFPSVKFTPDDVELKINAIMGDPFGDRVALRKEVEQYMDQDDEYYYDSDEDADSVEHVNVDYDFHDDVDYDSCVVQWGY